MNKVYINLMNEKLGKIILVTGGKGVSLSHMPELTRADKVIKPVHVSYSFNN